MLSIFLLLFLLYRGSAFLTKVEPRQNLWVTWANQTNSSSFCLSFASATDPFRTCLIGVPGFDPAAFTRFSVNNCNAATNDSHCAALLLSGLNTPLLWDPQELDLLGSRQLNASANESGCILFGSYRVNGEPNLANAPRCCLCKYFMAMW